MFCFISKWKISRSHDLGKPLSGLFASHIDRCQECGEFARSLESMSDRLRGSVEEFLQTPDHSLDKKIKTALKVKPVAQKIPRRGFVPAFAMAAALVVILVTAVFLFQVIPEKPSELSDPFNLEQLASIDATSVLQDITGDVETSFETEISLLEQYVKSAAQSLASGLYPEISE